MTALPAWPEGRRFAFTIFDDTDLATLQNVRPVYDFLADLGLRITKSVWPLAETEASPTAGMTCQDDDYLSWLHGLKRDGFEIGYHMAACHSSQRARTEQALDEFKRCFGDYPRTMANHSACRENIYWGDARMGGLRRAAYNLLTRYRFRGKYLGHVESSGCFWGDLCRDRITYVRNFVYPEINTLKAAPQMPYHDPTRPYVRFWYAASEGPDVNRFNDTVSEAALDRLEEEGGACIMYTHLARGFWEDGRINPRFAQLMERLSQRNGWLVPVGTLLDYLRKVNGDQTISKAERTRLERRWLRHKLTVGRS